jgi:23S rRNA pseudouridine1911/1915/1917 synthase
MPNQPKDTGILDSRLRQIFDEGSTPIGDPIEGEASDEKMPQDERSKTGTVRLVGHGPFNSEFYTFLVDESQVGKRLDVFLSSAFAELNQAENRLEHPLLPPPLPPLSRTRIQELIETGYVTLLPERPLSASLKTVLNDQITLALPEPEEATPVPQDIALEIVYEDEDLLVINKAAGMVVHPSLGHWEGTLVNALLAHCGASLSGINGVRRPGIVHRLDKDTSGLMVVAKNDRAHQALSDQFSDRSLSRTYYAFVWGVPHPQSGTIETLIGRHRRHRQKRTVLTEGTESGKAAVTHYRVLQIFGKAEDPRLAMSLVECKLATGRTHQIRVHLAHMGHPLVGDPLYGKVPKGANLLWPEFITQFPRQALHAKKISFIHPRSGMVLDFSSELPPDMEQLRKEARGE